MKIELKYENKNYDPIKIIESRIIISDTKNHLSEFAMVKNIERVTTSKISKLQKIKDGVLGITRAALGLGLASQHEIDARRAICNACEYKKGKICGACGCLLNAKTKLAKEQCPKGFWGQSITIENKRSGGCGCGKNNY
tara:strand:- start:8154 stop:8570 length:417 start_codon:yes stop_codon:yes gene_type:complete